MTRFRLRPATIVLFAIAFTGLVFDGSAARADDPNPIDPTLTAGNVTPLAQTVAPDVWAEIESLVLACFPDADYATICYYAEVWFYALPPDYSTLPIDPLTLICPPACTP